VISHGYVAGNDTDEMANYEIHETGTGCKYEEMSTTDKKDRD